MSPFDAVLIAVAGLVCGVVNSIAGGGSLVLFPAMLVTGMPALTANVTNSVATWPGYVGGVIGFRRDLVGQGDRLRPLVVATVAGSGVGSVLLLVTPEGALDVVVPFLVLAATGLTALQPWARRRLVERSDERRDESRASARRAAFAIGVAAVYGGYFGGALGVIFLAVLGLTVVDSLRRLNAAKAVLTFVDATIGVAVFALFGPVQWAAVAIAAPGALLGGLAGARLARRLDERVLRTWVITFGLVVGLYLLVRLVG